MRASDPFDLLAEGAAALGTRLEESALEKFRIYLRLLHLWGAKMNLVSRLDDREIVTAHFLDSLSGCGLLRGAEEPSVMDIGAGAGFPSLPLKICLPGIQLTLVESSGKKASFCEEVIRQARLTGARVLRARAQDLSLNPSHAGSYHWVVSRALASAGKLFAMARPFLLPGGRILLYKGALAEKELQELHEAPSGDQAKFRIIPVSVPGLNRERNLLLVSCD